MVWRMIDEGPGFHILPVLVCVFAGYSDFLPQSKDMMDSKW